MDDGALDRTGRNHRTLVSGTQLAAVALSVAACLVVLFMPLGEGVSTTSDGSTTETTSTLWNSDNPQAVGMIMVAAAIPLIALVAVGRWRRPTAAVATVLLTLFVMVGILSVGMFFLPATIAQLAAAIFPTRRAPER
jgi:hypothetical protein